MNQALGNILSAVSDPSRRIAPVDVEALAAEYPFFTLPAVMLLRQEGDSAPSAKKLLEQIALNAPDSEALMLLADPDREEWAGFYPDEKEEKVTTESVISTFLETYGHASPAEDALLERLIFNPTPDYSTLLAREEEKSLPEAVDPADDSQDALINAFILSHRTEQPATADDGSRKEKPGPHTPLREHPRQARPEDNSSLTESLAKIYIRQKRYDKAFEIIHTLSLNNPKKSSYFADQLRFLRKLMLVQQLKDH